MPKADPRLSGGSLTPIGAYLLSALVFGIDHGYQGLSGILATGFLALVFTALF